MIPVLRRPAGPLFGARPRGKCSPVCLVLPQNTFGFVLRPRWDVLSNVGYVPGCAGALWGCAGAIHSKIVTLIWSRNNRLHVMVGSESHKRGKWEKISTLDKHPESIYKHPKTLRESIAINQRRWKNVSVAHSAPNSLRERALFVFFVPATEIIGTANLRYKGNSFTKCKDSLVVFVYSLY